MIKCCCVCGGRVPERSGDDSESEISDQDSRMARCRVLFCGIKCSRNATIMRLEGVSYCDLQRRSREIHDYVEKIARPDTEVFTSALPISPRQQRLNALDAAILGASQYGSSQLLPPVDETTVIKSTMTSVAPKEGHSKGSLSQNDESKTHLDSVASLKADLIRKPSATIPLSALRGHALARKPSILSSKASTPLIIPPPYIYMQSENIPKPWLQAAPNRSPTYPLVSSKPKKLRRSQPIDLQIENNLNQFMDFPKPWPSPRNEKRQILERIELFPPRVEWNSQTHSSLSKTFARNEDLNSEINGLDYSNPNISAN